MGSFEIFQIKRCNLRMSDGLKIIFLMVLKYKYGNIGPENVEKYVAKWCILNDPGEKSTSFQKSRGGGKFMRPCFS